MFLDGETKAEWLRQIRYARSDQNRDILLSDKRNTPFRVSSRTVFRCVASLFFVVFIAHQKHGKHSANVFALHSMQLDWTITLAAITSARYLSLLFFFFFFLFLFNFPSSPNKHRSTGKLVARCFVGANNKQLSRSLRCG